jgi:hypothetical protein
MLLRCSRPYSKLNVCVDGVPPSNRGQDARDTVRPSRYNLR